MKKNLFVCLVLFLLFSTGVMAQDVRFGVRAGMNVANWTGDATQSANTLFNLASDYTNREFRTGFHAGVYTSIPLSSQFTLEPGVQYSQKGTVLKGDFTTNGASLLNATVTNKASYIDVPLLAKFYVTEGFHLFAGPQVSFLLSNQFNTKVSVLFFSLADRDLDVTSNFRRVDVGLTGGLGYRVSNGLNFSLSYDHGLNTLDPKGNIKAYNQVIKASIGFDF